MLTITECAYIAGIVDGEGCITISKRMAAKGKSYSYRPEVIIVQAPRGLELLTWLKTRIGGAIHPSGSAFALRLAAQDTKALLDIIEPFTVIKKEQVATLRAFYKTFDGGYLHSGDEKGRIPNTCLVEREDCFQRLHVLHGGSKIRKRRAW